MYCIHTTSIIFQIQDFIYKYSNIYLWDKSDIGRDHVYVQIVSYTKEYLIVYCLLILFLYVNGMMTHCNVCFMNVGKT